MNPCLGALTASFAPAYHAAAEGLMDDVRADRYSVGALRVNVVADLAGAVIHVSAARRRSQGRAGPLGSDTLDKRGIDLTKKARGPRLVALTIQLACQRIGQVQELPRAGHPDVAEPALLLDLASVLLRAKMRK